MKILITAKMLIWIQLIIYMCPNAEIHAKTQNCNFLNFYEQVRIDDYTYMWWAEGFPGNSPSKSWLRCIQTGYYAMVLDTEKMQIANLGPVTAMQDYATCALANNRQWQALPSANLKLTINVNGEDFHCRGGGIWTNVVGPRIINSGRFVQRADVTDLSFTNKEGKLLDAEARFETVAWPDRLSLILSVRPGLARIKLGEGSFGRIGGGYGFDGRNHLEVKHSPELEPEQLTLELFAFLPAEATIVSSPWLVCKNGSEWGEGNYGLVMFGDRPRAWMNIGGGPDNMHYLDASGGTRVKIGSWNHLAMSYDGDNLLLYVNGIPAGSEKIGKKRIPGNGGLSFGRRQDNDGDGYHFRGALDEIRLYDRVLSAQNINKRALNPATNIHGIKPVREWSFRSDGKASENAWTEEWKKASIEISLRTDGVEHKQRLALQDGQRWMASEWREVSISLLPGVSKLAATDPTITVKATELHNGKSRLVELDPMGGWYKINLDGINPIFSPGNSDNNNTMERIKIELGNPTASEVTVRMMFEKTEGGFLQKVGAPITGISAVLRDINGNPTGIPVQISKNWHGKSEGKNFSGIWFHGFSQVHLPSASKLELELSIVYGHWGGAPAVSHSQLCLIGWGSHQLWDQVALGSWGESLCFEPDQVQAQATILDVRPLMVLSKHNNEKWHWTHNVGGGDFFRFFDSGGNRVFPTRMKTAYLRTGPVLTEVTYAGYQENGKIEQQVTVGVGRTNDIIRSTYRLRMNVTAETSFSRFVIFQIGADSYSPTSEQKMAIGNKSGLVREWSTGNILGKHLSKSIECQGEIPWISLHESVRDLSEKFGAWANRGLVIRNWKACIGGNIALPWAVERISGKYSTIDLVPPDGVCHLIPGDYVDATIEHIIMPRSADDYYGPNKPLQLALEKDGNTWKMIQREAVSNHRQVTVSQGVLNNIYPTVKIHVTADNCAMFSLCGGLGYISVTFTGLNDFRNPILEVKQIEGEWAVIDQSQHGKDFWQTDFNPVSKSWEITYSIPSNIHKENCFSQQYRFKLSQN